MSVALSMVPINLTLALPWRCFVILSLPHPTNRVQSKIENITPLLPRHHQASLTNLGETLETLVVRRSENLPFVRANEQCQLTDEPAVVRPETRLAKFIVHTPPYRIALCSPVAIY